MLAQDLPFYWPLDVSLPWLALAALFSSHPQPPSLPSTHPPSPTPPPPLLPAPQVFIVDTRANKKQIKDAVARLYDIQTRKINTLIRPDGQKKAYVRLTPDYDALDVANKIGEARGRARACMWRGVRGWACVHVCVRVGLGGEGGGAPARSSWRNLGAWQAIACRARPGGVLGSFWPGRACMPWLGPFLAALCPSGHATVPTISDHCRHGC